MKNIFLLSALVIGSFTLSNGQDIAKGKELFRNYCKACHALDQRLVGPPLAGVMERRDSAWIYNFIKGSQSMIEAGDETAVALFNEYNKIIMPNQTVTDEQIGDILHYVRVESAPKPASANPIQRPVPHWASNKSRPMEFTDVMFWIPFTISVFFVIIIIYYMIYVTDLKRDRGDLFN